MQAGEILTLLAELDSTPGMTLQRWAQIQIAFTEAMQSQAKTYHMAPAAIESYEGLIAQVLRQTREVRKIDASFTFRALYPIFATLCCKWDGLFGRVSLDALRPRY